MAATLVLPAVLAAEWQRLRDFCDNAWSFAQHTRENYTDPTAVTTLTLEQVNPVAEQANVLLVLAQLQMIKDMVVKVSDATSEYEFAINLLKDRAYRKPQLPSSIEGPHFDTVTLANP
jgi:ubiquinone biosynthesis protein COQ9